MSAVHPIDSLLRRRLAENLRTRRIELGLTVKDAASRAGLHTRHWQKLESGELNVTVFTLVRAASAVKLDPVDLLVPLPKRRTSRHLTLVT